MTKSNPTTIREGKRRWIYVERCGHEAEIVVYGQHYGAQPVAGDGCVNLEINNASTLSRHTLSVHEARQLIDMLVAGVADVEASK